MKRLITFVLFLFLAGCTQVTRLDYTNYPKVSPDDIDVVYKDPTKCEKIKEIAIIITPRCWNMNFAIEKAKDAAADLGADGIIIRSYNHNEFNDVAVDASAYKCIDDSKK